MSYAAFKMQHGPTGIENCAAGFLTPASSFSGTDGAAGSLLPNLIVTAGNVLDIYAVRTLEEKGGGEKGFMDGISGAQLEVACHYMLHGNVESIAVLSDGSEKRTSKRRDSVILAFRDAKICVLEFDESTHRLQTSSMHCFEGPDWQYLKRGRESFPRGPIVKTDPQGRCAGVLIYGLQMVMLKSAQAGHGLVGDEGKQNAGGSSSVRVESSYIISLRELEINHVKDFIFVHGYIEPVLVVLHEKEPTWAGRLPWKHNTCMLSALSISTTLKQHPVIWSASNLPHDAYKLLAVPAPLGGVLVMCANAIYYHSQSTSCSLALNSFSSQPDGSLEMPKSNFSVELDAANATWLSNDIALFSVKTGELLLVTLVNNGRGVQRLDLTKANSSVLTSGMTTLGNSFFFLASRLGDSILVQYCSGASNSTMQIDEAGNMDVETPLAKRLRRMPSDPLLDVSSGEELSLFTTTQNSSDSSQKSFSFVVRDSLINIGPIKDFLYGLRMNADLDAAGLAKQSNYELVCCSGHGKNGALSVLQQSIRPELITEVELTGCKGIWTVYHKNQQRSHSTDASRTISEDEEYHSYLIISLENRTMVLETADDLGEVTETVDYFVHGCTIAAGNLFGRRRVVQIFACGARILDGSYMTQELIFNQHNSDLVPSSEPPVAAFVSIADPYVLLRMTDGAIHLLVGDPSNNTVSLTTPPVFSINSSDPISACALYHDKGPHPWLRTTSTDAWLSTGMTEPIDSTDLSTNSGDVYCIVTYESGKLEIFDVPGFKSVYSVENFISGKTHLSDTCKSNIVKEETGHGLKVVEVAMHRWPGRYSRPYLFGVLNDGTLLSYRTYFYEVTDNARGDMTTDATGDVNTIGHGIRLRNLRFVRVQVDSGIREEETSDIVHRPRITVFNNVGGYQGLFLNGSRPAWIMACRERLRMHPQFCDGAVVAFTILHNVNCNHGFICVTSQGFLKICQLPAAFNYDNYWPVQKIPLHGTPHQVAYHAERNLYPTIVSVPVIRQLSQLLSSMADQEMGQQMDMTVNPDDMQKTYTIEEFEVRVLESEKAGGRWETKATIPMQNFEHALTVRTVTLHNTTTKENETLMAVGTAYVQGEDVPGRGRVLLFSFASSSEPSQNVVSEIFSRELKGAVSAVASLQGHLLIASGPKITLNKWTGSELMGVAFYDAPLHVVSLNIVKNFVLFGDIHKSIFFLNWKEQGAQLSMLAKDFGSLDCYATEFLIDGSTLSLVVSDAQKNIQIFYYAPKTMESWKGQKLLSRAEFHAGVHITKFLRLQMLAGAGPTAEKTNRFALLFSTLDGSLGCVAPLDEFTFKRLQLLQKKLVDVVPHVCGLNPRAFRQFRSDGRVHRPGPDSLLDFELLSHYEMLSLEEQIEVAVQIKSTRSQILSNLSDLTVGTSFL
ncbi:cleavage and polyadenylation specificity factor 160 isoform X1 [Carex rostrata]